MTTQLATGLLLASVNSCRVGQEPQCLLNSHICLVSSRWLGRSMQHAQQLNLHELCLHAQCRASQLRAQDLQVGTVFQPLMTYEAPPTYFSTGKLTDSFQNIVDAYGMARWAPWAC